MYHMIFVAARAGLAGLWLNMALMVDSLAIYQLASGLSGSVAQWLEKLRGEEAYLD